MLFYGFLNYKSNFPMRGTAALCDISIAQLSEVEVKDLPLLLKQHVGCKENTSNVNKGELSHSDDNEITFFSVPFLQQHLRSAGCLVRVFNFSEGLPVPSLTGSPCDAAYISASLSDVGFFVSSRCLRPVSIVL